MSIKSTSFTHGRLIEGRALRDNVGNGSLFPVVLLVFQFARNTYEGYHLCFQNYGVIGVRCCVKGSYLGGG